jgi:hypothetical protein
LEEIQKEGTLRVQGMSRRGRPEIITSSKVQSIYEIILWTMHIKGTAKSDLAKANVAQ